MRHATVALFVILCAGCDEQVTIRQAEKHLVAPERVDVKLGPKLANLTDSHRALLDFYSFPTGELAKRIFVGPPDCTWTIEVISSSLTAPRETSAPIGTFINYQISCLLTGPQICVPLSAAGSGQGTFSWAKASTAAVQQSLNSLAVQARVYLESNGR
jgi:hypothetical protein